MLFATEVLPMVLLLIVNVGVVPPLLPIPINPGITVAAPTILKLPTVLLLTFRIVLVPPFALIPHTTPVLDDVFVITIEPVVLPDPMVLPVIVPTFTLPLTMLIPAKNGLAVLVDVNAIF